VGHVVSSPLDFYSDGRSKAKPSKRHFVDDLLEDQEYKKYAKKRYREIQNNRTGLKPKSLSKKRKSMDSRTADKRAKKKLKKF